MNPKDLEKDLRTRIPLGAALGLQIEEATSQKAILKFPIKPNSNHVGSVFGGSLYSAGALSCYALFRVISNESGIVSDSLVIQEGAIKYLAPVLGDFEAICERPDETQVQRFLELLKRRSKGRLTLKASIRQDGVEKAIFEGDYVFSGT